MIVKVKKIIPTESQEMDKLMDWANLHPTLKHPEFGNVLVHIPNEGKRSVVGNMRLFSKGGAKSGFPDLFLPVIRANGSGNTYMLVNAPLQICAENICINKHVTYHAMFIELKRVNFKPPKPTNIKAYAFHMRQMAWIDYLNNTGFYAVMCKGADAAIEEIEKYLNEKL